MILFKVLIFSFLAVSCIGGKGSQTDITPTAKTAFLSATKEDVHFSGNTVGHSINGNCFLKEDSTVGCTSLDNLNDGETYTQVSTGLGGYTCGVKTNGDIKCESSGSAPAEFTDLNAAQVAVIQDYSFDGFLYIDRNEELHCYSFNFDEEFDCRLGSGKYSAVYTFALGVHCGVRKDGLATECFNLRTNDGYALDNDKTYTSPRGSDLHLCRFSPATSEIYCNGESVVSNLGVTRDFAHTDALGLYFVDGAGDLYHEDKIQVDIGDNKLLKIDQRGNFLMGLTDDGVLISISFIKDLYTPKVDVWAAGLKTSF